MVLYGEVNAGGEVVEGECRSGVPGRKDREDVWDGDDPV
jgi:hypothetical protein